MVTAFLRALLITGMLVVSLAVALGTGLLLADMGALGTCQDGTCQLVAAIYVMPGLGVLLYFAMLACFSYVASRRSA